MKKFKGGSFFVTMTCLKKFVQINSIGGHEAMEFNEDEYLDIEQRQEIRNKAILVA